VVKGGALTLNVRIDHYLHFVPDDGISKSIQELKELIMVSNAELLTQINDLKTEVGEIGTQLTKSQAEIVAKIAALEATVAAGGNLPPDVVAAFNDLKASVDGLKTTSQALDDITPDTPTP